MTQLLQQMTHIILVLLFHHNLTKPLQKKVVPGREDQKKPGQLDLWSMSRKNQIVFVVSNLLHIVITNAAKYNTCIFF
jgi:tRNA (Thr-GGU) A37 N-methylase